MEFACRIRVSDLRLFFSGSLLFFQAASVSVIPAQVGIFFGVRQCGVFRRVPGFGRDTRLRGYDGGWGFWLRYGFQVAFYSFRRPFQAAFNAV